MRNRDHSVFLKPVQMPQTISRNGLRTISNIGQTVLLRTDPRSEPAPLRPFVGDDHRQRTNAGSRTEHALSPRMPVGLVVLPEGSCGGWASRERRQSGMSGGGAWRAPGAGLRCGSVAWSGGAGSDDHGQPRIAVTDGSRERQPSGLELLPDLPPRDFVPGRLPIALQLAVGQRALGFGPALREVFSAARQPRGRRAQQVASPLCADPVGAFGPV